jgi:sulfate-transporting ATPase
MTEFLKFALLGLGLGGIYALTAQGVVVVYRGSGILNFAHAALVAVGAFAFVEFRDGGSGTALAVVGAIVLTGAVGVGIHLIVMRPLRRASPLTRVVATLAIATVLRAALLGWPFYFNDESLFVVGFLPDDVVRFSEDLTVGADRLWILGFATVLSAAGWAVYRYTRFGLITRAAAENETAAAALGRSPDTIAATNWFIGSALAGLAGVLVVPIIGLSVNQIMLLLVPALAAALVGGFRSFPLTLVGGLLIGVTESLLTSGADWIPELLKGPGWSKAVPFLVIIIVLVVRGRALPLRSHVLERLPGAGTGRVRPIAVLATVAVVAAVVGGIGFDGIALDWVSAVTTTAIAATVCLSLVVVTGYTGQFSLAQYALAGIGAYVASRAASGGKIVELFSFGKVDFEIALVLGVLCAGLVGVVVGLPALRTRGVNLAIVTLGLALLIERVVFNNGEYTGGFRGTQVPSPDLFGLDIDPGRDPRRYALFCVCAFTVAALVVANLRRGRAGRRLLAVRTNERAAASLGISVVGAKLYGFGIGAGIAGLGGIMLAFRARTVLFADYSVFNSIQVVVQTVLGGVGFIGGAIIGGAISIGGVLAYAMTEVLGIDDLLIILLTGLLAINNLIQFPNGLASQISHGFAAALDAFHRLVHRAERPRSEISLPPEQAVKLDGAVLNIEDLRVRFGGVVALDGVNLTVAPGEIVGLIGPNGAGKTTLIDAVSGFNRPASGSITLDGTPIDRWSPRRRARAGIARSFQSLELFEDMSVADNLRAGSDAGARLAYLTDLCWPRNPPLQPTVAAAIREFELVESLDRRPTELPYGRRRLVAIARALATEPTVLLLDEPAAGLDDQETEELGHLLRRVAAEWGLGILLVEHDMGLVMSVCDRLVALDFGTVIAEGPPDAVRSSNEVITAYLGTAHGDTTSTGRAYATEPAR